MHIKIFTTGGTIDKIYFDELSEFQVGEPQIGKVLEQVHAGFTFSVEPVFRKDSLELTPSDRAELRRRIEAEPNRHILVTHGTDSMAETGRFLAGIPGKVIVLTGALTPAKFRESDAVFNVGFAVACVQILADGVHLAMNGRVFDPQRVRKNRLMNRFEAVESEPGGESR